MPANASRLLALRVIAKLFAFAAVGAFLYVSVGSILPSRPKEGAILTIALSDLPPGQIQRRVWGSRRVMALRRTPEMISALEQANDGVVDGASDHSRQPEGARNGFRSIDHRFFIALDHDPTFGCPLELASAAASAPVTPWRGGFRDVCRGSWYDLAGHVYKEQPSDRNLIVPPYTIEGDRIIVKE